MKKTINYGIVWKGNKMKCEIRGTALLQLFLLVLSLVGVASSATEPPLRLVTASLWGTAEEDDIQGAAQTPDGTVYLVGNVGGPMSQLPGGVKPRTLGADVAEPKCGRAFIARLSADCRRVLNYTELGAGIAIFTSVQVNENGVYVGGCASDGLEPLLSDKPSLLPKYPLATEARLIRKGKMLEANGLKDKDPIAGRPGLGRLGAPCVLRFNADLSALTAGTYLEGWQQVWEKDRVKTIRPREIFPKEFFWQPTSIGLFKSGDVAVCHDGGYFRMLTEKDRALAGTNTSLLARLAFYDCADWVSRLSPDLSKRVWRQAIQTPQVNIEVARRVRDWHLPHYGNPRTHRMRLDHEGNVFICGWSATHTAKEPWWSPYLWKLGGSTGKPVAKFYEYDPMSGPDNRINGTVSDTAVATVTFDADGNILTSLFADGGNTVMGWSPQAVLGKKFEGRIMNDVGVKLVHWWGMIHRLNARTGEGIGDVRLASKGAGAAGPAWAVDLAALPDGSVLALGRCNLDFSWSTNAWHRASADENPVGFLRVYSREFHLRFSTALPGVVPFELVPLAGNRFLITGRAQTTNAPIKDALVESPRGKTDGFFCVVEIVEPTTIP